MSKGRRRTFLLCDSTGGAPAQLVGITSVYLLDTIWIAALRKLHLKQREIIGGHSFIA
jgi:hypothetical protein